MYNDGIPGPEASGESSTANHLPQGLHEIDWASDVGSATCSKAVVEGGRKSVSVSCAETLDRSASTGFASQLVPSWEKGRLARLIAALTFNLSLHPP